MKFIDEVTIEVASGKGGAGCVSFRREMFVPRGGPDGGDGGRGGSVIFKTSTRIHSLLDLKLKTKYRAPDGEPGGMQKKSGADGEDMVITVPPGTIIKAEDGTILKDLGHEETFEFLAGGIGGKGNPFYKTSVNQAPTVAQKGMPGRAATIRLELKLLADVGIVGMPNAGKSTLISHISSAKPKIADYPFTTLVPNLGVVRYGDEQSYVVADMPGLIKDAHKGVGLGVRFLKHIERTKCFVHVIDASSFGDRNPLQDYKDINFELRQYDKAHRDEDGYRPIAKRRQIVALNKADIIDEQQVLKLTAEFKKAGVEVMVISAATGKNIKELINKMGEMVFHGEENEESFKEEGRNEDQKAFVSSKTETKTKKVSRGKAKQNAKGSKEKAAGEKGRRKKTNSKKAKRKTSNAKDQRKSKKATGKKK